jgi:probable HAF family extracellular repeat protein
MKSLLITKAFFIAAVSLARAGTMTDLGALPGGNYATANSLSPDGSVVIGISNIAIYEDRAFRWTAAGGLESLGVLPGGSRSNAFGISADGSVVVGYSESSSGERAFRWTAAGGMIDLGTLVGVSPSSNAFDVSADGSVVVGHSTSNNGTRAFRWTSGTGMVDLGVLPGGYYSYGTKVSGDGSIVVGYGNSIDGIRALRWTDGTGMQSLGTLPGDAESNAFGISSDGSVIVGYSGISTNVKAFRWTSGGGMESLGALPGGDSIAYGVSANGSVIVGRSTSTDGTRAFRWTAASGMKSLGVLPGGAFSEALDVSADGNVIVGFSDSNNGTRPFIYSHRVMLDAQDWLGSVAGVHSTLSMGLELSRTFLEGAHHRPLADLGRGRSYWVTGDIASSSRSRDVLTRSGEAGATFEPWANVLIGVGGGYVLQDQQLANGGSARNSGQYLVGEVDLIQDDGGVFSLLLSAGDWDNVTHRGYVTGGGVDYSHGVTDLASATFRLRYDSPVLARAYATDLKAYVSYGHSRITSDAYAETGGSYAGSFGAMKQTAQEGRVGFAAVSAIDNETNIRLSAEWIHRFDQADAAMTVTDITSTLSFSMPSADPTRDQARIGLDVDHKLDDQTTLSVTVHAAGVGESPDVSGAISLRRAF